MENLNKHSLGHTLIRLTVGVLFIIMGVKKLVAPDMIIGMLGDLNFPIPTFLGWLLLLSELIFGALILVGYKVKYTAWPIAIILVVAWLFVALPTDGFASANSFFHLISIAALITIALSGPGEYALTKE